MEFAVQSLEECEVLKLNCGSKPFTEAKFTSFDEATFTSFDESCVPCVREFSKMYFITCEWLM